MPYPEFYIYIYIYNCMTPCASLRLISWTHESGWGWFACTCAMVVGSTGGRPPLDGVAVDRARCTLHQSSPDACTSKVRTRE
jgi:hypothetical protein